MTRHLPESKLSSGDLIKSQPQGYGVDSFPTLRPALKRQLSKRQRTVSSPQCLSLSLQQGLFLLFLKEHYREPSGTQSGTHFCLSSLDFLFSNWRLPHWGQLGEVGREGELRGIWINPKFSHPLHVSHHLWPSVMIFKQLPFCFYACKTQILCLMRRIRVKRILENKKTIC